MNTSDGIMKASQKDCNLARSRLLLAKHIHAELPGCKSLHAAAQKVIKRRRRGKNYAPSVAQAIRIFKRWVDLEQPDDSNTMLSRWKPGGPKKIFSPDVLNAAVLHLAVDRESFLQVYEAFMLFGFVTSKVLGKGGIPQDRPSFSYRAFMLQLTPETKYTARTIFQARQKYVKSEIELRHAKANAQRLIEHTSKGIFCRMDGET